MPSSYNKLYVHMLWSTDQRRPLLSQEVEAMAYDVFTQKCGQLSAGLLCVGGVRDHVHLLLRILPEHSVALIAKELKGASSHFINRHLPPGAAFRWQNSYAAFSVGRSELDQVFTYVREQKLHHQQGQTLSALEPDV